jgi:hypothetical protein
MDIMSLDESPWEDYHHRSSFLPNMDALENNIKSIVSPDLVQNPQSPILTQDTVF